MMDGNEMPKRCEAEKIADFLCGAAPNDDGLWFNDASEAYRGAFWWRKPLRKMQELQTNRIAELEVERDKAWGAWKSACSREDVNHARAEAAEAKLASWQAAQHYSYIGLDGKQVRAVDLENRAIKADAKLAKAEDGLHKARTALDDVPEYHGQAMGCGVEDRGIVDRYEAAAFGWEQALHSVYAEHVNPADEILRKTLAEIQGNP